MDFIEKGTVFDSTEVKLCSRDFGDELFMIRYSEAKGGNAKTGEEWDTVCHSHTIILREKQYTFDLTRDIGYLFRARDYAHRAAAAKAYFKNDSIDDYAAALGMTSNGESREIAGSMCREYENKAQGVINCLTDDLLLLQATQKYGFIDYELTAISLEIGDGGPDENYRLYEKRNFVELPENGMFFMVCTRKDEIEAAGGELLPAPNRR